MPSRLEELFARDASVTSVPAGWVLYRHGDRLRHAFVILEGDVEVVAPEGAVRLAGRGSIVGEPALVEGAPLGESARALTDARVVPVDRARLLRLASQTPFFAADVLRLLADDLASAAPPRTA